MRLETIFNQRRKVPPSVKRILTDKETHPSDYTYIYSQKENIQNLLQLFNVTLAHRKTSRITFDLLSTVTIEKACVE